MSGSLTVTVVATSGPLLWTVIVYVAAAPTVVGPPDFVTERSAVGTTTLVNMVSLLFVMFGSTVEDETDTRLEIVVAVAGAWTMTMNGCAERPPGMSPIAHVSCWTPLQKAGAEMSVTFGGRSWVITTFVAMAGPQFVTTGE